MHGTRRVRRCSWKCCVLQDVVRACPDFFLSFFSLIFSLPLIPHLQVVVHLEDRSYFVFRRYNEFHALQDKLKKHFPELGLKLPGKRFLGNNFDPSFIRQRMEGLHEFVLQLLRVSASSMYSGSIVQHPFLRTCPTVCCHGDVWEGSLSS